MSREFERYRFSIPPEKMHDLLFYATMYIGEGGTISTEAAILGTPSILINPLAKYCGVHRELQNKYKLKFIFSRIEEAQNKINNLLETKNLKKIWRNRRKKMIKEKIDVTKWMINFIENLQC